ncbi:TetR/AcrR family transcriptional regulator [Lacrimispora algidixylanolytica]|uniref:TetR family transcriptional regulator n=1 Tax=Lacrimispora algidixylanolytica TaxID=94868 RepID=A0A419TBZ3_9FIRM|nr:TetR/AcrR family transcriptional regulator [Lacrimispora algidixylanolytica]RKD34965.1 TetR family transcriptional regulator [Lacrimispora algidixylanolytica]
MESKKTIREPQQVRSIQTKEKILNAAYKLFCEKGFYKTTTNEIARVAEISIGSLYVYFRDKDTILLELLDRYNESFMIVHEDLDLNMKNYTHDLKLWLKQFIKDMIKIHMDSRELNQELMILCHTIPEVAAVMEKQQEKVQNITLDHLVCFKDMFRVKDLEAASIVAKNLISSTVDQVVFYENKINDERIISAGVDAVYQYLIG